MTPSGHLTLTRHDERLAVAQLGPGSDLPAWASSGSILSITATATETSIVCTYAGVPQKVKHEGPFTPYTVDGRLAFSETGILAALLQPLADEAVSVFTISTYDTDWILVPQPKATAAEEAWRRSGHAISTLDQTSDE